MPLQPFQPLRSGSQLSAGELNRLAMETEAQDRVVASGAELARNGAGIQLLVRREVQFWAKITSSSGSGPTAHAWTEQLESSTGTFSDLTGGRTGTTSVFPAYSLDGGTMATNTIVRLFLGVGGDFYLVDPGLGGAAGATLTVQEADGSPSFTMVNKLLVNQAQGLTLSQPAANQAQINFGAIFSGARITTNSGKTVVTGGLSEHISFDVETFDTDGYWTSGEDFLLTQNVYYLIGAHVIFPTTGTAYNAGITIETFGPVHSGISTGLVPASAPLIAPSFTASTIFKPTTASPVAKLGVYNNHSADITIVAGGAVFWIQKLGT